MSAVTDRPVPPAPGELSTPRPRSARLAGHAALLALVLLAGLAVFGRGEVFHPDEGVMRLQAQIVDETGGFAAPNPQPELDPEMDALPLELALRTDQGTWLPFAKHPTSVLLMVGASRVFGALGPLVVSSLAVAAAALGTALIAERARPGLGVPVVWATGLAAPLFFDAYIAIPHAVGAALAAFLALAALRAPTTIGARRVLLVATALVLSTALVLVRTEGIFLVGALAAAIAVFVTPRPSSIATAVGILAAAFLAYRWLDPRLLAHAVGGDVAFSTTGESGLADIGTTLSGRWDALWTGMFEPSASPRPLGNVMGLAGFVAIWCAAIRLRLHPADNAGLLVAVGAVLAYAVAATTGDATPGVLVAAPVLAGLAGLRRSDLANQLIGTSVAAWVMFTVGVAATQYDSAGGGHVGGRYFVIGLPLIVPAAVLGWMGIRERVAPTAARWLPRLVVSAALLTSLQAGLALREQRDGVAQLVRNVEVAREQAGSPAGPAAVLSTNGWGSRFAWHVADDGVWLAPSNADLDRYSARLAALGEPIVLLTADAEHDEPILERRWHVEWRNSLIAVLTPL